MEKVKFGIIGLGNQGSYYCKSLFNAGAIENGVLAAIADVNPDKIKAIKDAVPGDYACYDSGDELIDNADVDAIIIAVPHYFHPPLAIRALKKGVNVICEKPAGVYTKQVKEMNAAAEQSDKLFTMMYNQRTNPAYIKMHDMINSGEIGEVRRVNWIITNWFRTQFYYDSGSWRATWKGEGGGVLLNQCPHQLDLLQWVCGMLPSKVRAFCHFGKWHNIETEDDVTAYLEFPNGATGAFITTTADAPGSNRFEVTGSKATLICEGNKLIIKRLDADLQETIKSSPTGFAMPKITEEEIVFDGVGPQHAGIINNFANAILGKEALYVDGREGLNCVQLMDSMLLSTWEEKPVAIPVDDEYYYEQLKKRIATSADKDTKEVVMDSSNSFKGV